MAQYHENSRYYSAVPPESNRELDSRLPHVTIELPVHKESLEDTMLVPFPLITSLFCSFLPHAVVVCNVEDSDELGPRGAPE